MKRIAITLAVLALIGAAINFPFAFQFVESTQLAWRSDVDFQGVEATRMGWPSPPPLPWPDVTSWGKRSTFGYTKIDARAVTAGQSTHSMALDLYGWPLPCIQHRQLWWPWNDPQWDTPVPSDPGPQVRWTGAVINPVLFALAAWLLFFAPFIAWRTVRRSMRARRHQCIDCGYPLGQSGTCSECGRRTHDP